MNELAFIKDIQHEPLALLVVAVVIILRIIDLLVKHVPLWFSKEKVLPFWKWQSFVAEKLSAIESTLATHEFLLDKTSESTLENMLFNDSLSPFIRLKAFRRLLAKKKNGRIWDKGFLLILENKKTVITDGKKINIDVWLDVLDTELGIPIVDNEYYEARLKEIRRRIYDDFSEK
jgi:hypothetical protein